jgi:hypothetical protein
MCSDESFGKFELDDSCGKAEGLEVNPSFRTGRIGELHAQEAPRWLEVLYPKVLKYGIVWRGGNLITVKATPVGVRVALEILICKRRGKRRVQLR